MDERRRANQALWDNWTALHERSSYYDVEGFKAGRSSLTSLEVEELGDVTGKSLLHLQCHFGLDTLSWARRGARVTGVDFSGRAIAHARALAAELGLPARFVQSDVYDLPAALDEAFDIVFSSYGVLYWLPDLSRWAQVVASFVQPGGVFSLVEHHPVASVFAQDDTAMLRAVSRYFHGPEPERYESYGSYAVMTDQFQGVEYGWRHTLGEVVSAITASGLRLEYLHEFPFSDFPSFQGMQQGSDGWWRLPAPNDGVLPLLYSLRATRPAEGNTVPDRAVR